MSRDFQLYLAIFLARFLALFSSQECANKLKIYIGIIQRGGLKKCAESTKKGE